MIKRLKTKYGVFLSILVLFSIVVTLSYSAFIFSTDKYRSTELLISKLNYGITITEDKTNLSSISGSKVTVPKGSITYYNIVISSINKIDSKYTLAYKTSSSAVVKYTDRTPWNTSGYIKGYDENTYSKRIRVVIDNSSSTTSSTVDFAVYGGYTFNTYASIELNSGYVTVTGPYTEELASISNRLVDIVENDTGCVTSESSTCLYGGDSIKNYVQYPTNEDKTKNIWRILGSYIIDGETVTKMIKVDTVTNLDNLYNTLTDNKSIILSTNKFNCFSSTCNTSDYTNIGILTNYEYNQIGGNNSYLQSFNPFLVKTENGFNEVTDNGINEGVTSSNLKPVVYIQTEVQTSGSGTSGDPYTLTPSSDINLVAYTLNGQSTTKTYAELLTTNVVKNVTCKNGTVAKWDNATSSINLSSIKTPDYCTIDFTDGYTVTLTATNGTVNPSNISVGYGGSAKFTVTPNSGFIAELETNSCGGTLSGNTYTISNITSAKSCSITFKKNGTSLATLIQTNAVNEKGYRYEGSNPNNYIQMEKTDGTKETWRIIGLFPDGANGENVIRVRKVGYEEAAYDEGNHTTAYFNNTSKTNNRLLAYNDAISNKNYIAAPYVCNGCVNHWPSTTLYTTLSSTYTIANYKNTVNYKMYLGTSESTYSLTAEGWHTAERGATPGATAASSYNGAVSYIGSVGLIYPSDYGYAVLSSDCARTIKPHNYYEPAACKNNNWLYQGSSSRQWLISPDSGLVASTVVLNRKGDIGVNNYGEGIDVASSGSFSPVMALKSEVMVTGSGTQNDPYVMN